MLSDYSSATILTDDQVAPLWLNAVENVLGISRTRTASIVIPHGERSKNMRTVARALTALHQGGVGRDGVLIALGGGVVGDITGFVASIYKRGIDYVQIPTSLIALTDSAVGGKTGIDFAGSKNSVGTFYQSRAVACDPRFLDTLPRRELMNGMAEVIKYGLIGNTIFVDMIASHSLDDMPWERVIDHCVTYKAALIARDERDTRGQRALLNFGHTIGHAIEALSHYRIPHGHGVAIGMTAAARISTHMLGLRMQECKKIDDILRQFGLPTRLPLRMNVPALMEQLKTDKKTKKGMVQWVLLEKIGQAVPGIEVPPRIIKTSLHAII